MDTSFRQRHNTHDRHTSSARISESKARLPLHVWFFFFKVGIDGISREPKIIIPFISYIHHVSLLHHSTREALTEKLKPLRTYATGLLVLRNLGNANGRFDVWPGPSWLREYEVLQKLPHLEHGSQTCTLPVEKGWRLFLFRSQEQPHFFPRRLTESTVGDLQQHHCDTHEIVDVDCRFFRRLCCSVGGLMVSFSLEASLCLLKMWRYVPLSTMSSRSSGLQSDRGTRTVS